LFDPVIGDYYFLNIFLDSIAGYVIKIIPGHDTAHQWKNRSANTNAVPNYSDMHDKHKCLKKMGVYRLNITKEI
jgi:hypothetical protein